MLQPFLDYIEKNKLFPLKETVLLTVSGGIDSIVMTELFHRSKLNFAIAHCNFQLRGKDSDEDEKFVKGLAKKYKADFYSIRFDTKKFSKEKKLSLQEAARTLRYEWFSEIAKKNNYFCIATAHHLNDSIETFFINLLRGTGISGLTGIRAVNDDGIVRPLLFATRNQIEIFAKENNLPYREDHSNKSDDYLRNKIRHHLIPLLEKLNPSFEKTMANNLQNLIFTEHVFNSAIISNVIQFTHEENGSPYFSRKELKELEFPVDMLYEFLCPFNFNSSQVKEIWSCKQSGKVFYSGDFRVTCDRDKIFFGLHKKHDDETYLLKSGQKSIKGKNIRLKVKTISLKEKNFVVPSEPAIACLDNSLLQFPMKVRKWKTGDWFHPLGMNHRKKVSDFLIDNKISLREKEKIYVLLTGDDIVSILGHRIDNRYKITAKTKKVLRIDYISTLK